jgi:peptide deformylase
MPLLPILIGADNPILRRKTAKVASVTKEVKLLLKDMEETVRDANGAGLAAPQVGQSLRICIALLGGRFTPLINPEITWRSSDTDRLEEGCLSLPGIWREIARPRAVTIRYLDARGTEQERRLEGFDARVAQHEIDHLEGVLIVDYVSPSRPPENVRVL